MATSNHPFFDAQEMMCKYPETFHAPSMKGMKNDVKVGTYVRICAGGSDENDSPSERFWVKVTEIHNHSLTGVIDNDLIYTDIHGLKYEDVINFELRHIYNYNNNL